MRNKTHVCLGGTVTEGGHDIYDGNGIYVCRVCEKCESTKLKGYRKEIIDKPYTRDDVLEEIEPQD